MSNEKSFQDYYPDELSQCYGCGALNEKGLQIKTYWEGEETITHFMPRAEHTAIPGYVYGGLLASLIDCHGTGSASAAAHKAENRELGSEPPLRFVTASLQVNYLKPTPMGVQLTLRGKILEVKERKVVVKVDLFAEDQKCVIGEVIAVKMPEHLLEKKPKSS